MKRSKKVFIAAAAIFFLLLFYVSYDISRRTTFPGSKGQLKERIRDKYTPEKSGADSLEGDSTSGHTRK